ncbi:MAG: hypothetical protein ACOCQD_01510 [archaeon]
MEKRNFQSWLTGRYVVSAIGASFSKRNKYPSRPVKLEKEDNTKVGTKEHMETIKRRFLNHVKEINKSQK